MFFVVRLDNWISFNVLIEDKKISLTLLDWIQILASLNIGNMIRSCLGDDRFLDLQVFFMHSLSYTETMIVESNISYEVISQWIYMSSGAGSQQSFSHGLSHACLPVTSSNQ